MALLTLEQVETAIQEVLINQSYEVNDRKFTRADLDGLRALRKDLISEIRDDMQTASKTLKKGAYHVSFK